jgi:hypothetical protein
MLQVSASRAIWSRLFRIRDWTSYIYLPVLFFLLILLPYYMVKSYRTSNRLNRLVSSLAQGNPNIDILSQLMAGPIAPFKGEPSEEIRSIKPLNYKGFTILQDSCILDFRPWNPSDSTSLVYGSRCLEALKNSDNDGNDVFRVVALPTHPEAQFRFPPSKSQLRLQRTSAENSNQQEASCHFEVSADLSKLPNGQVADIVYEYYSRGVFVQRGENSTKVTFRTEVDAMQFTRWFLLPKGEEYRSYQIVRYETGRPGTAEVVKGLTEYIVDDPSIIAFKIPLVKAGYTIEVTWFRK